MDNLDIRTLTKQIAEDNSVQIIEIVKSMSDYQYWEKEHLDGFKLKMGIV